MIVGFRLVFSAIFLDWTKRDTKLSSFVKRHPVAISVADSQISSMQKKRRPGEGSRVAGAGWTIPTTEAHHWWPKGLSKLWADHNGEVCGLSSSGRVFRTKPENLGAITNAHLMKFEGPWNGTLEPIFDFADNNLPKLVSDIQQALRVSASKIQIDRWPLSVEHREILAEGLASLVVRSPGFRERIRSQTNYSRSRFNLPPIGAKDNLIVGNIHQWYPNAVADFRRATFALVYSPNREFILGQGYLNNLAGPTFTSDLRAVVPVTPSLCFIAYSGQGCVPETRCCIVRSSESEIEAINNIAQIYTKEFLYFRSQQPQVSQAFERNEFLEIQYHRDATVEGIISSIRGGPSIGLARSRQTH